MTEMLQYFSLFDNCVTDACEFLGAERPEFFELAAAWIGYTEKFSSYAQPEQYYREFVGDAGRANLCANIIDQFGRIDIARLLPQLPNFTQDGQRLSLADVGCGTAALSFPQAARYERAHLVDLPNMAQEFVRWRTNKYGFSNIITGDLTSIETPVQVMTCIDVLEHLANSSDFFRMMHARLSPGGLLVLRIPWRSLAPHPEHLAEAEANWHEDGGEELLRACYHQIQPIAAGGIYRRK